MFAQISVLESTLTTETALEENKRVHKLEDKFYLDRHPEQINFWVITGLSPDNSYFKSTFPYPNLIRSEVPCHLPFQSAPQATLCHSCSVLGLA